MQLKRGLKITIPSRNTPSQLIGTPPTERLPTNSTSSMDILFKMINLLLEDLPRSPAKISMVHQAY
jgi:hypothetical protein